MTARPDLVACWLYRVDPVEGLEILLIRRSPDRTYPGLWQCVTGRLEPDERITDGALRELAEETGFEPADLEAFLETDIVNWFHEPSLDAIVCEAVFAAQVRGTARVRLSPEHDDARWCSPAAARAMVVWPAYHRAIDQVEWLVGHPDRAAAYRLPAPT
jgi:8-oxo-dGTP pyrophosphatase MutT (NUDIX family)